MNKIKYLMILISINAFSVPFFNQKFNVEITEKTHKELKVYNLKYNLDEIKVEVLSPKVNKGEIYTYKNDKKYIYYPLIEEEVEQSYANSDNDVIFALKVLKDIEKTTVKDGRKYIVKNNKIIQIKGTNYTIDFKYIKDKISKIEYKDDSSTREYIWKY